MKVFICFFLYLLLLVGIADVVSEIRVSGFEIPEKMATTACLIIFIAFSLICFLVEKAWPGHYLKYFLASAFFLIGLLLLLFSSTALWEGPLINFGLSLIAWDYASRYFARKKA